MLLVLVFTDTNSNDYAMRIDILLGPSQLENNCVIFMVTKLPVYDPSWAGCGDENGGVMWLFQHSAVTEKIPPPPSFL